MGITLTRMATRTEGTAADETWFDAWRGLLFASAHMLSELEPMLEAHSEMSLTFLDILGRLYDAPDQRLRMQDLQKQALFTRSGITRLVDRIEQAGMVRRERVPGDRRGVYVVLTPEGAERYEAAIARHHDDIEQVFGRRLSQEQHQAIADALWSFWHEEPGEAE
jgi:DNA-binding MarR family transcriptional regulator